MPNKFQEINTQGLKLLALSFAWFLAVGFLVLPLSTHAQIIPCSGLDCKVDDLFEILVNIYNFLLGLAALVAMLFIVWGGTRMIYFSYMEDSASELSAAKLTVRRAVAGFVVIAMAYLLVSTALAVLGIDKTTPVGELLTRFGLL